VTAAGFTRLHQMRAWELNPASEVFEPADAS
jgi:hypothetical protein